ncbi:MAG: PTS glucose transporter subunit IIA [Oscillospiraceae bacterium]|nr:PTS glucose transporter subunit IIA [Oscillospiraceae bacterium]MCI9308309.1 PTS glucose transporter subunit IIA [Oscillospiraceae bacterium]MCI9549889.1 PTS glucose transporter subunit IIA [Oscillospiraceae bacterium]
MGFFDKLKKGLLGEEAAPAAKAGETLTVCAVAKGNAIPMADIPDPAFSQGFVGFCCGIEPEDGKVFSPVDGTVSQVPDTLHAVGLESGGMELLVHCGVDTVDMKGQGFTMLVKEGQAVKTGDPVIVMDLETIKAAGHPTTIITAVTNSDDFAGVKQTATGPVQAGDAVLEVTKA